MFKYAIYNYGKITIFFLARLECVFRGQVSNKSLAVEHWSSCIIGWIISCLVEKRDCLYYCLHAIDIRTIYYDYTYNCTSCWVNRLSTGVFNSHIAGFDIWKLMCWQTALESGLSTHYCNLTQSSASSSPFTDLIRRCIHLLIYSPSQILFLTVW